MAEEATIDEGFNESELADIMDEIEGLEQDFHEEETPDEPADNSESLDAVGEEDAIENSASEEFSPPEEEVAVEEEQEEEQAPVAASGPDESELEAIVGPDDDDDNSNDVGDDLEELSSELLSEGLGIGGNGSSDPESLRQDDAGKTAVQQQVDSVIAEREESQEEVRPPLSIVEPKPQVSAAKAAPAPGAANLPSNAPAGVSKMELAVSGNLELTLNFLVSQQKISLRVEKNEGLVIELGGGMKFTVPLK